MSIIDWKNVNMEKAVDLFEKTCDAVAADFKSCSGNDYTVYMMDHDRAEGMFFLLKFACESNAKNVSTRITRAYNKMERAYKKASGIAD